MSGVDNWGQRKINMKCRQCMHYAPKDDGVIGRCRRHAPTLEGWPSVYPSDWCGDFKIEIQREGGEQ